MSIKIVYLSNSAKTEKALSVVLDTLTTKLDAPEVTMTVSEILPLVTATLDLASLAGKLEETISALTERISIYEMTASSQAPKPTSAYATKLDQRLTATSDLLRALVDRLDQVETAVTRLYKPPFLQIDPNDKSRKRLAVLRNGFDVVCGSGSIEGAVS